MISNDIKDKLENIANHTRQSARLRNDGEGFVRDVLRQAKLANIQNLLPVEQIEGLAAEQWLLPLTKNSKAAYPLNIMEIGSQRRNHKLILKLLRHPDDAIRVHAAEHFQVMYSMIDGYFDEASSLINQVLLIPTEIPEVKYALLRDAGRTSRRGFPREIADTARRLIHDVDLGVSYHALRLLSYLHDMRDWKTILDRMVSLIGEDDEISGFFLTAGFEYLSVMIPLEPAVVDWIKMLVETYPTTHKAIQTAQEYVRQNPDIALQAGLINKQEYKALTGT